MGEGEIMSDAEFILLDKNGRPLPSNRMTEKMRESLKEYLDKNQNKLVDFWRRVGFGLRPPVRYDLDNERWYWEDREDR